MQQAVIHGSADTLDDMAKTMEGLNITKSEDQPFKIVVKDGEEVSDEVGEGEDDGYSSEERSDKGEERGEAEDEEVLEPLSFICSSPAPTIHYISRGPIDQESHYARNHPYSRPRPLASPDSCQPPPATVLVLKKADTKNPSRIEARVTWTNKHELAIEKYLLPEDTFFGEDTVENKVQLFIQLNPNIKDLKSFLADVKTEQSATGESKMRYIGPIVISLKTELAQSQEKRLLEQTTMEERTAAYNLVHQKELSHLTSGIGPHKDTVLSVLCAKRNPENPGQTFAQIHAVVQRLINHPDPQVKQTVLRSNNNQISAFEIAAITNNNLVASFLAEVIYNISEDTPSALRVLNCKDTQGNTILHLLARKGDSNLKTMHDLIDMHLTDGTKVFTMMSNSKRQFPMHIATQNLVNQPATIQLLYQHMPRAFEVVDDDGMTALHYACQRTTDVEMVGRILSYKKDNINSRTKDGLTALDLIMRRCRSTTQTIGIFAIEPQQHVEIINIIRNNGGRSGVLVDQEPAPRALPNTNMGYNALGSHSPPLTGSPEGSPYSCHQSTTTSPHTLPLGSPSGSFSNPSMNSVGSFQVSSPDTTPQGSPALAYQPSPHYSAHQESPGDLGSLSYEDHIASQILNQFPEIGHILDNQ